MCGTAYDDQGLKSRLTVPPVPGRECFLACYLLDFCDRKSTVQRTNKLGGSMSQHDLAIRSGSVIDGTGEPAFSADVAIKDGKIAEVGKVAGRGVQEVSAAGALVPRALWIFIRTMTAKRPGPIACRHQVATALLPWSWATAAWVLRRCGLPITTY